MYSGVMSRLFLLAIQNYAQEAGNGWMSPLADTIWH
jgi:hypothetical protein